MPNTSVLAAAVLAIDAATEICSVAVLHGDQLIESVEHVGNQHSNRVLPMIDAALARAELKLGEIDIIAFGAGPGSFTGLRIACGVAQGLAYGKRKQVVAVGNLRALAAAAFWSTDHGTLLLAAVDARMNEAYCAVYRRDDEISEVKAPALASPHSLAQLARDAGVQIVAGNALRVFGENWPHDKVWTELPDATPTAGTLARLARLDAARGLAVAPERAAPIYVRDHVALTIKEREGAALAASRGAALLRKSRRRGRRRHERAAETVGRLLCSDERSGSARDRRDRIRHLSISLDARKFSGFRSSGLQRVGTARCERKSGRVFRDDADARRGAPAESERGAGSCSAAASAGARSSGWRRSPAGTARARCCSKSDRATLPRSACMNAMDSSASACGAATTRAAVGKTHSLCGFRYDSHAMTLDARREQIWSAMGLGPIYRLRRGRSGHGGQRPRETEVRSAMPPWSVRTPGSWRRIAPQCQPAWLERARERGRRMPACSLCQTRKQTVFGVGNVGPSGC